MVNRSGTVTILFAELVNSRELLQRAGDEDAQCIFQDHQKPLHDALADYVPSLAASTAWRLP
jgi:hypothetical protein